MIVSSMNKNKRRRYCEYKEGLTGSAVMMQVTSAIKEREEAVATKGRLDHMLEGKDDFMKVLSTKHKKEYQVMSYFY